MGIAILVFAVLLIWAAARFSGGVFSRFGQPKVMGEILGGLFLGPTLLGALWPEVHQGLFESQTADLILPWLSQLGLGLLMFCSGLETRLLFRAAERRISLALAVAGTLFPFCLGLMLVRFIEVERFIGQANHETAFHLVFSIAIAVTSIPVISRILRDLGIFKTSFSRIILSAAVLEDILLYAILGVTVSLVSSPSAQPLPAAAGIASLMPEMGGEILFHMLVTGMFFVGSVTALPPLVRLCGASSNRTVSFFLLSGTIVLMGFAVGVPLMLTSFAAGMAASLLHPDDSGGERIKKVSFAIFIPIYFGLTGLKLNLLHHFDPLFFCAFFGVATLIKAGSVYAGAVWAGETNQSSLSYAVAMNARGGPGIVLGSVALETGIINLHFYAIVIMLSVISSLLAAVWLRNILRRHPLQEMDCASRSP